MNPYYFIHNNMWWSSLGKHPSQGSSSSQPRVKAWDLHSITPNNSSTNSRWASYPTFFNVLMFLGESTSQILPKFLNDCIYTYVCMCVWNIIKLLFSNILMNEGFLNFTKNRGYFEQKSLPTIECVQLNPFIYAFMSKDKKL